MQGMRILSHNGSTGHKCTGEPYASGRKPQRREPDTELAELAGEPGQAVARAGLRGLA